ncbi:hypothetical protein ACIO02_33915 [Streptomyces sp. NPDC087568]|uniref:hypothetical protein n=1 Tax=Streptomyces sp. NPDC087568 TaxID=3365799 RepID=UPI0038218FDD
MFTSFRLDRKGIGEILKSDRMLDAINETAVNVAANARGRLPSKAVVTFRPNITDRQRASVTVTKGDQSTRAALISAARAAGLEVHENPPAH